MSRFIDADALMTRFINGQCYYASTIRSKIETAPTEDAVQVVRCKDCKYLSLTTLGMEYACWHGAIKVYGETGKECDYTVCQRITNPEHYCSYGERKDDAGI